jgi:hypothetical protein
VPKPNRNPDTAAARKENNPYTTTFPPRRGETEACRGKRPQSAHAGGRMVISGEDVQHVVHEKSVARSCGPSSEDRRVSLSRPQSADASQRGSSRSDTQLKLKAADENTRKEERDLLFTGKEGDSEAAKSFQLYPLMTALPPPSLS